MCADSGGTIYRLHCHNALPDEMRRTMPSLLDPDELAAYTAVMPSALGKYAVRYAGVFGLRVFPLRVGSKIPVSGEKWRNSATTDLNKIMKFWQEHPNNNIGLPTGERFDCIDVDGETGKASWKMLADKPGVKLITVKTPSGAHIWIPPTGRKNTAPALDGLDFRGEGGYVVAAPSHFDGDEKKPAGDYSIAKVHSTEWPTDWDGQSVAWMDTFWVKKVLAPAPRGEQQNPLGLADFVSVYNDPDPMRRKKYMVGLARGICAEMSQAPKGRSSDTLNALAYRLGRMGTLLRVNYEEEGQMLMHAALARCGKTGNDPDGTRKTYLSGLTNGIAAAGESA